MVSVRDEHLGSARSAVQSSRWLEVKLKMSSTPINVRERQVEEKDGSFFEITSRQKTGQLVFESNCRHRQDAEILASLQDLHVVNRPNGNIGRLRFKV